MTTHTGGYVLLAPDQGLQPSREEIAVALEAAGWSRWDGTGNPSLCVFHVGGPKGDYFEAGFWAGQGVPWRTRRCGRASGPACSAPRAVVLGARLSQSCGGLGQPPSAVAEELQRAR
jgi:hypothetical protein